MLEIPAYIVQLFFFFLQTDNPNKQLLSSLTIIKF